MQKHLRKFLEFLIEAAFELLTFAVTNIFLVAACYMYAKDFHLAMFLLAIGVYSKLSGIREQLYD